MQQKGTMDWISMHHLVGTRQDSRFQRRIQRLSKDGSELDWEEDGGKYAKSI